MKVLGIISLLFGVGLLVVAGYGFSVEIGRGPRSGSFGMLLAFGLFIAGSSATWFAGKTFFKARTSRIPAGSEDILDAAHSTREMIPDNTGRFTRICGFISLVGAAFILLFTAYGFYLSVDRAMHLGKIRPDMLTLGSLFGSSGCTLIYVIRTLFSRQ
jgi:hypothetical protein